VVAVTAAQRGLGTARIGLTARAAAAKAEQAQSHDPEQRQFALFHVHGSFFVAALAVATSACAWPPAPRSSQGGLRVVRLNETNTARNIGVKFRDRGNHALPMRRVRRAAPDYWRADTRGLACDPS
jgi:hypothetical protein